MNPHYEMARKLGLMLGSLLIVSACNSTGSDSGEDGVGGDTITTGDTLPSLAGLTGVPSNDNWLYFTSNATGNPGLFAFNPQLPDNGAELIDADAYMGSSPYVFHPIPSAMISGNEFTDYHAEHIFYRLQEESQLGLNAPKGFRRVATEQSPQPATETDVSSETNTLSTHYFFQFDLDQPLNTVVAYGYGTDDWRQIRVGDDSSVAPVTFDPNHTPVVPLGDGNPKGWLAIDKSASNELVELDINLNAQGQVLDGSGDPVVGLEFAEPFSHLGLEAQLVVLTFEDQDTDDNETPMPELWLYETGNPGTIKPLLNANGEKLTFSGTSMAPGASLPSAQQLVVREDEFFFAFHEITESSMLVATTPRLYKVDKDGWSLEIDYKEKVAAGTAEPYTFASPFLIDAGDHLIWLIDDELTSIDLSNYSETVLYEGSSVSTPIVDSNNGWFFYNDDGVTDKAVAARTDGSKTINLNNAAWVGASSTGTGNVAMRLAKAEVSEVFLMYDDGTLGVVQASQPDAGMVTLGKLPSSTEDVRMFGMRPGPHQLLQVEHDDDSVEIVYVNTEEANSLRYLMDDPSTVNNAAEYTRPVYSH